MWSRAQEIEEKMETDFSFLLICFKTYDQILPRILGSSYTQANVQAKCFPFSVVL